VDVVVIRAVLFDMDGTLADTERLQWEAYRRVLRTYGVDVGLDEYRTHWIAVAGGPDYACRTYQLPIGAAELRAQKTVEYRRLIQAGVDPMPGARAALERLRPTHRLAVATNTVRDEAHHILGHLGLRPLLHAIVTREDYAEAKPAPDAWLAGAAALDCAPAECVVVEDTQRGARAGIAAGMRVVAVPSDITRDNDFTGCARRLSSLDELTVELLEALA
jgi:HAD superfamily hydrolase (TIGR01509 family)